MEEQVAITEPLALRASAQCVNLIFLTLFLVFPGCVSKVFATFTCIDLEEVGRSYLRSDLSVDCTSAEHRAMQFFYALPMLLCFPVGVPLLLFVVMWRHRARLHHWSVEEQRAQARATLQALESRRGEQDSPAAATSGVKAVRVAARVDGELPAYVHRLTAGYTRGYFWFELFEMLRKLALIGLSVAFEPGSLGQLIYGLGVCFASFGLCTRNGSPNSPPVHARLRAACSRCSRRRPCPLQTCCAHLTSRGAKAFSPSCTVAGIEPEPS